MSGAITIRKVNELYIYLDGDISSLMEIKENFTFYAKGYKYHPKFKHGLWDGRISMLMSNGYFYAGLLSELMSYCKANNIAIKIIDPLDFRTTIKFDQEWLDDFKANKVVYDLHDYQENSFKFAVKHNKSLIVSPTGSGKSIIIYTLIRFLIEKTDCKVLINVPSINLVEQLFSDFNDYVIDDFDVAKYVMRSYGTSKDIVTDDTRVVIETWQSTSKKPESLCEYGAYICDEAHTAPSKELSGIIDNLAHCHFRVGLTGTLDGTDMHTMAMTGRFGIIYSEVTTAFLVKRGDLANFEIDVNILDYPLTVAKKINKKGADYQTEIDFLVTSEERNRYLCNLALEQTKNTLMIFNFVEKHGVVMHEMLKPLLSKCLKEVYFVHGGVKGGSREKFRKEIEHDVPVWYDCYINETEFVRLKEKHQTITGDKVKSVIVDEYAHHSVNLDALCSTKTYNIVKTVVHEGSCILLASYGTVSVGVNIKNLHSLIFCHPRKSPISVLQTIGRVIRKADNKDTVKVYDIGDKMLNSKEQPNFTYRHVTARLEIYEKSQFVYSVNTVSYDDWFEYNKTKG